MRTVKTPPILTVIEKALDKKYNAPKNYTPKPNMRPSFLGTECVRKIYYEYLRVEKDSSWTPPRIRNFEKGDHIAMMVKDWFRSAGILIDYRDPKTGEIPNHGVTGQPDPEFPVQAEELHIKNAKMDGVGIFEGVEGVEDGLWVIEFKSINEKGFERYIEDSAKKEHEMQGMTYTFLFEECLKRGDYAHIEELKGYSEVKGVIFIYINRENDNDDWKEFVVPKNSAPFLKVVEKIVKALEHVRKNTLPPKTWDMCDWCDFQAKCKKEFKVNTG